jgi:hypothetical protein
MGVKKTIAVMLLFGWTTQASAVTIDFESVPNGIGGASLTTQGFTLTATGPYVDSWFIVEDYDGFGASSDVFEWCVAECTLSIEAENQSLFDLHSFDFTTSIVSSPAEMQLTGFLGDGGTINTTLLFTENAFENFAFGSEWSGLDRIEFGTASAIAGALDNIVVSQIPIPAAVWLFGSALAVLGWMRRKKTV